MDLKLFVACLFFSIAARDVSAVDISQCGEVVNHGRAILQADITCPRGGLCQDNTDGRITDQPCVDAADCSNPGQGCLHFAVLLAGGGSLSLNGHTIAGVSPTDSQMPGVLCEPLGRHSGCKITGPGTISTFYQGIYAKNGAIRVTSVSLSGNFYGIDTLEGKKTRLQVRDTVTSSNRYGIVTAGLDARGVDASGNSEIGIFTQDMARGIDLTVNDNGEVGLFTTSRAKFLNLTATGNGGPGVAAVGDIVLQASTLTGNNGAGTGYDILASTVRLQSGTTCGKSAQLILDCSQPLECDYDAGATLGLCSGD